MPDSEGAWICVKHKLERGHAKYGSHCYRCLVEKHGQLQAQLATAKEELDKAVQWGVKLEGINETLSKSCLAHNDTITQLKAENADLCDNVDAARQDLEDYQVGKLQSENKRLREALEEMKKNSYPGLAVKESTLLNRVYRIAQQALKE